MLHFLVTPPNRKEDMPLVTGPWTQNEVRGLLQTPYAKTERKFPIIAASLGSAELMVETAPRRAYIARLTAPATTK